MKKIHYILFLLLVIFCACDGPNRKAQKTLIVYMAAENSLSDYAYYDLNEIDRIAASIPKGCQVVVYVDRSGKTPALYHYGVHHAQQPVLTFPNEINSCDPQAKHDVLEQIVTDYPSEEYGLVLWSHGNGWVPMSGCTYVAPQRAPADFGIDNGKENYENSGYTMSIQQLDTALTGLPRMSFILFDACFMQSVEVAYELRRHTDYIIGSPAEIPGNGARYDLLIPDAFDVDWKQVSSVSRIAQSYFDYYYEYFTTHTDYNRDGLVISLIDTRQLDALASLWKECLPVIYGEGKDPNTSSVQYYTRFYSSSFTSNSRPRPDFYDMQSAANAFLANNPALRSRMLACIDKVVPYHAATDAWATAYTYSINEMIDKDNSCCVSMFFPFIKYQYSSDFVPVQEYYRSLQWYRVSGLDSLF